MKVILQKLINKKLLGKNILLLVCVATLAVLTLPSCSEKDPKLIVPEGYYLTVLKENEEKGEVPLELINQLFVYFYSEGRNPPYDKSGARPTDAFLKSLSIPDGNWIGISYSKVFVAVRRFIPKNKNDAPESLKNAVLYAKASNTMYISLYDSFNEDPDTRLKHQINRVLKDDVELWGFQWSLNNNNPYSGDHYAFSNDVNTAAGIIELQGEFYDGPDNGEEQQAALECNEQYKAGFDLITGAKGCLFVISAREHRNNTEMHIKMYMDVASKDIQDPEEVKVTSEEDETVVFVEDHSFTMLIPYGQDVDVTTSFFEEYTDAK